MLLIGLAAQEREAVAAALPDTRLSLVGAEHALELMREYAPALAMSASASRCRRRPGPGQSRPPGQFSARAADDAAGRSVRGQRSGACRPSLGRWCLRSAADSHLQRDRPLLAGAGAPACPVLATVERAPHRAINRRRWPDASAAARRCVALRQQVLRVAPTDASIVLTGESGTGKEVIARALHAASRRSHRAFVAINCAAIPETLLESELFGYERGAFTGALEATPGQHRAGRPRNAVSRRDRRSAHGLQAKLLRFLQERVIERLGGRTEIPLDVRIICATHRELSELIAAGRFREDLFLSAWPRSRFICRRCASATATQSCSPSTTCCSTQPRR